MILSLGKVDEGCVPANPKNYFLDYHATLDSSIANKLEFGQESKGKWLPFSEVPGSNIKDVQQFLKNAGFLPKTDCNGIFGYSTQAGVRLFQEYVRTVTKADPSMVPDGVVGPNTLAHIEKWKQANVGVCRWGKASAQNPSEEFSKWIALLAKVKSHFLATPGPILSKVQAYNAPSDTRKIADWDTSPDTIHLIGIRRNQGVAANNMRRADDDLFVLLINGMVFKFWGSTDPSPKSTERPDIPFLSVGQHDYRFGWHFLSNEAKTYRAMKPASKGVLVFRDRDHDTAFTDKDIEGGLEAPNPTINIHWSGIGVGNWSAGCQVIAGESYINDTEELIDCRRFAANGNDDLGGSKTRAAYNVFTDLLLSYGPEKNKGHIVYTLGREGTLDFSDDWKGDWAKNTLNKMKL